MDDSASVLGSSAECLMMEVSQDWLLSGILFKEVALGVCITCLECVRRIFVPFSLPLEF